MTMKGRSRSHRHLNVARLEQMLARDAGAPRNCWKEGFPDQASALEALAEVRLIRGRKKMHVERRVYKCKVCPNWHLTSQSKAKYRAKRWTKEKAA